MVLRGAFVLKHGNNREGLLKPLLQGLQPPPQMRGISFELCNVLLQGLLYPVCKTFQVSLSGEGPDMAPNVYVSRADLGKLRPAGRIRPGGPFNPAHPRRRNCRRCHVNHRGGEHYRQLFSPPRIDTPPWTYLSNLEQGGVT